MTAINVMERNHREENALISRLLMSRDMAMYMVWGSSGRGKDGHII